jgi:hypothetical protein
MQYVPAMLRLGTRNLQRQLRVFAKRIQTGHVLARTLFLLARRLQSSEVTVLTI